METQRAHHTMIRYAGTPEEVSRLIMMRGGAQIEVKKVKPTAVRAILGSNFRENCDACPLIFKWVPFTRYCGENVIMGKT